MKERIKRILHTLLGFDRYLFVFALFKIKTFKYDKKEGDFFQLLALLKEDDHVLDVGSNIGVTTVLLSKKVPRGKVYSFEPLPPNYTTLEKVVQHHKCNNVNLYKMALGNETGEIEMVLPEVNKVRMHGLSHVVHEDLTDFNEGKRYKAALHRLDDLEVLKGKAIKGIKLDVENFEYFVLVGAENLIKQNRPVVYAELWDNENRTRCFELMEKLNYDIFICMKNDLIQYNSSLHETQNFFFLPKKT